jgi:hypothetical protein
MAVKKSTGRLGCQRWNSETSSSGSGRDKMKQQLQRTVDSGGTSRSTGIGTGIGCTKSSRMKIGSK